MTEFQIWIETIVGGLLNAVVWTIGLITALYATYVIGKTVLVIALLAGWITPPLW